MKIGISTASYFNQMMLEEALVHIRAGGCPLAEAFLNTFTEYSDDFCRRLLETLGEAVADGILPDAIEYVATGFVDGDLEEVFCRE